MDKTKFEWQADEDEYFDGSPQRPDKKPFARWRWLTLAIVLIAVIASSLIFWMIERQQRQMEENLQQDVRANFNLWWKALRRNDDELYAQLLTTEDRIWRADQRRLFGEDLVLGRSFLGLSWQNQANVAPSIELTPDWERAVVSFAQTYSGPADAQIGGPVRLLHTAVFDRQDYSWVQAPLDEAFWGEWQTDEYELLIVHYPARDAGLAKRISQQLDADLQALCSPDNDEAAVERGCRRIKPLILKMSTESDSLEALSSATGPVHIGSVFQLPTPTLVGLPLDDLSYEVFFQGYTDKLVKEVQTVVGPPIPMPEQVIRALCFDYPNIGAKLYKYDLALGMWEAEQPDRSFRFLDAMPEDEGLILDVIGEDRELWHSRLIRWHEGSEELLLDEAIDETPFQVVNPASNVGSYLLLRRLADHQSTFHYSSLDLRSCNETGCELGDLPGYALWSPDGQRTLLQVDSKVYLGDSGGQILDPLGTGFNPFWLNNETIAYIRYVEQSAGLSTELVMVQIAEAGEKPLFNGNDLAEAAGVNEGDLFIRYVAASPADPKSLLVHASGLHEFAGHYFIFSVRLPAAKVDDSDAETMFHLQREGSLSGETGVITPTGYLPFLISPDGRWLLISELIGYNSPTRTYLLYDLQRFETKIISAGDPVFPAQFPSYDWSDDGRWLVIAGDGFFRLLAPDYDYEQLLHHDFDYCVITRWSD